MLVSILLLRGINVGRTRRMSMKELHELCTDAGSTHCTTYVQSGNACLVHPSQEDLLTRLSKLLEQRFSENVALFIYTLDQWSELIRQLPFSVTPMPYVSFLQHPLSENHCTQLRGYLSKGESIATHNSFLYYSGTTPSHSKFSNALVESITDQRATTRNWNTVIALQERAQTMFC